MKKIICLLVAVVSVLLLASCDQITDYIVEDGKIVAVYSSGRKETIASGNAAEDIIAAMEGKVKDAFTVAFDSDGGSAVAPQIVKDGAKAASPEDPVKEGYKFLHWVYKGEVWSFVGYSVTENMILKAVWEKNAYDISFDTDGGNEIDAVSASYGDPFVLPEPEKTGYAFQGWTLNGEPVSAGNYLWTESVSLKASWAPIEYSVEFISQDQTLATLSYTVESESLEGIPEDPSREGYTFTGWFRDEKSWEFVPHSTAGDIKLTANWEANQYTVTYNLNGGSGKDSDTIVFDSDFQLPTPERTGYAFSGWLYNGTAMTDGSYSIADSITVDASWTPIVYTATFKAFGKTLDTETFTVETAKLTKNPSVASICTAFRIEWDYELKPEDITVNARYFFGAYEQDDNLTNGKEPIEWIYLGTENGRALMLSKYALDTTTKIEKPETPDTSWEDSFVRKWLNSDFLDAAFSASEKNLIVNAKISNPENPVLHTPGCADTTDRVFLLSVQEVLTYFPEYSMTAAPLTQYAISHAAQVSGDRTGWWWLRTVGIEPGSFMFLHPTEYWEYPGTYYSRGDFVLRPAIRVAVN